MQGGNDLGLEYLLFSFRPEVGNCLHILHCEMQAIFHLLHTEMTENPGVCIIACCNVKRNTDFSRCLHTAIYAAFCMEWGDAFWALFIALAPCNLSLLISREMVVG